MKRISRVFRQKSHIFFTILIIMCIGGVINPVTAWENGSYTETVASYNFETNFGTHDWVAYNALNLAAASNPTAWSWLTDRRNIYLIGTEAPDNAGLSLVLNGETITGFGDTTYHHIYFNEDGSVKNNEADAAIRAKWCGDQSDVAITDEKWDQAAFYMGAMNHYIADMAMYAHIAQNNVAPYYVNFDEHHPTIEGYVNTRSNEYDDLEEFFQITTGSSFLTEPTKPYNATLDLAWDTYADPTPSTATKRDTKWLHDHFFTGWVLTYASREEETNETKIFYYSRIEENLNNAIHACKSALQYVTSIEPTTTSTQTTSPNGDGFIAGYPISIIIGLSICGILLMIGGRRKKRY